MICTYCGKEKGNDFYRGHIYCKQCDKDHAKAWYYENRNKAVMRMRKENKNKKSARWQEWYKENKEKRANYERERFLNNKEKIYAKNSVHYNLKQGNIKKGTECEICHSKGNIVAHHQNYSRPLDVNWLCKKCHARIHSTVKDVMQLAIA